MTGAVGQEADTEETARRSQRTLLSYSFMTSREIVRRSCSVWEKT